MTDIGDGVCKVRGGSSAHGERPGGGATQLAARLETRRQRDTCGGQCGSRMGHPVHLGESAEI